MNLLLCIIGTMDTGGAETFLMKIYRKIDKSNYQMDFCVNVSEKNYYEDEIEKLGGKVYHIPSKSENLSEFKKQLTNIIKIGNYKYVLRITSSAAGFLDLKIAKDAGATRCCVRSSNSSDGGSVKSWIVHKLGRLFYNKYIDIKIAPSDLAAKYTFGNQSYINGEVHILHNAIDCSVFKYDKIARNLIRKEFSIPKNTLVIGHVGRFDVQKNHTFLIDIFKKINSNNPDTRLLLVGRGPLEKDIRSKVHDLNLDDKVIFTGVRSDVPELLSAMDVFVFPSLYEGMPNTVIEAQATGLPCIIANTITREANITGLVKYLPLGDVSEWSEIILSKFAFERANMESIFQEKKYDIASQVKEFIKLTYGDL